MAGNLPVSNGAEIKLVWALDGSPAALNILHFTHSVGAIMNQAKADAIAAIYRSAFTGTAFVAQISTRVSLLRIESRHMDANSDPWFVGGGAATSGTSAANPLPAATAFCVTQKTGLRGRSFNGRIYLWGYTEDANDAAGGITTAAKDASVFFCGQTAADMNSAQGMNLAVLSRWQTPPGAAPGTPPIERTPPLLTVVTQQLALDQRWDVQRRRAIPGI